MGGTEEQFQHSDDGKEIFDKLEFKGSKRFKDAPKSCHFCQGNSVIGIELIGAKDCVLYWECEKCGERFLKFTKRTTIKHLDKASKLWIDLGGLKHICEELPN